MSSEQLEVSNEEGESLPPASHSVAPTPPSPKGQSPLKSPSTRSSDGIHREIHTFVLRQGHFTQSERKAYEELHDEFCVPYSEEILDFEAIFANKNPVVVEIGFGMGKATAIIAQNNPQINYLGIEVHKPGVGKLLGEIREKNLKNLRIIEHDAMEVLKNQLADESVSAFHIFFEHFYWGF